MSSNNPLEWIPPLFLGKTFGFSWAVVEGWKLGILGWPDRRRRSRSDVVMVMTMHVEAVQLILNFGIPSI